MWLVTWTVASFHQHHHHHHRIWTVSYRTHSFWNLCVCLFHVSSCTLSSAHTHFFFYLVSLLLFTFQTILSLRIYMKFALSNKSLMCFQFYSFVTSSIWSIWLLIQWESCLKCTQQMMLISYVDRKGKEKLGAQREKLFYHICGIKQRRFVKWWVCATDLQIAITNEWI